jgi:tRNA pseudouridine55 synthase
MTLEGILPVWKPEQFTSHDVVAKARRILGMKRIGHTGTLDPQVTGVLPLCLGRATRMVEYIQDLPKEYEAVLLIGLATDTEDLTGAVIEEAGDIQLTEESIHDIVRSFVGEIEQVPPMYSAVKKDGKRLYELAREGKEVHRDARKVTIYELEILKIDGTGKHPEIHFRALCSKGTYIRTLCVDIGRQLGYPSTMKQLIRTSTGSIRKEQCLTFEQIELYKAEGTLDRRIIPMDKAISHIPFVTLTDGQSKDALQGKKIVLQSSSISDEMKTNGLYRTYSPDERFLGLFEWNKTSQSLHPVKVFL